MVLAVGNGRVISLAEVPWGKEYAALQRCSLTFVCSGGGFQTGGRTQWVSIAFLMLFCVDFELLGSLEK